MSSEGAGGGLPRSIGKQIDHYAEGIHTAAEFRVETNEAIRAQVEGELGATNTQGVLQRTAEYVLAVALDPRSPSSYLVEALRVCPPGHNQGLDDRVLAVLATVCDQDELGEVPFVWAAGGGALPQGVLDVVQAAPPLAPGSWLRYLAARTGGDMDEQRRIVAADLAIGCPASTIQHLALQTGLDLADADQALEEADIPAMLSHRRWGDIAQIAIFLAEQGWLDRACEWSALIPEDQVVAMGRPATADAPHHTLLCPGHSDARILAPLALIDLSHGETERAARRAGQVKRTDDLLGGLSWSMAGDLALADWVAARCLPDAIQRRKALLGIHYRHTWLGLIQAQIEADLAVASRELGLDEDAQEHESLAEVALLRPRLQLHVGAYQHDELLAQFLPVHVRIEPGSVP